MEVSHPNSFQAIAIWRKAEAEHSPNFHSVANLTRNFSAIYIQLGFRLSLNPHILLFLPSTSVVFPIFSSTKTNLIRAETSMQLFSALHHRIEKRTRTRASGPSTRIDNGSLNRIECEKNPALARLEIENSARRCEQMFDFRVHPASSSSSWILIGKSVNLIIAMTGSLRSFADIIHRTFALTFQEQI